MYLSGTIINKYIIIGNTNIKILTGVGGNTLINFTELEKKLQKE